MGTVIVALYVVMVHSGAAGAELVPVMRILCVPKRQGTVLSVAVRIALIGPPANAPAPSTTAPSAVVLNPVAPIPVNTHLSTAIQTRNAERVVGCVAEMRKHLRHRGNDAANRNVEGNTKG